ncbi:cobalt transporter CbiM [Alkalihalobacterium bogoriense]|uniref:cobalt transporter CbiM n=1 Tax=Alkalihalobacterium bogoriense TaxID=246272 RepID=UPI00047A74B1|nr:cobalt transporter CbiM [Alkalihalobacterium bogoriense]
MHLADGVLSFPVAATTSIVAAGFVFHSIRGLKEETIPKVSLMTATFFVLSLISIPVGPSSVHPLLCGLMGIILGRRSALAIFIGLLLQALLFQHGGLTTLGANVLMLTIPALLCSFLYQTLTKGGQARLKVSAALVGGIGVIGAVFLLVALLTATSSFYSEGVVSVVRILLISHIPLLVIESVLTLFIIGFLARIKPDIVMAMQKRKGW